MIVVELQEEIRTVIPGIVGCLKDSDSSVRNAAIDGLSIIAAHGTCLSDPR